MHVVESLVHIVLPPVHVIEALVHVVKSLAHLFLGAFDSPYAAFYAVESASTLAILSSVVIIRLS